MFNKKINIKNIKPNTKFIGKNITCLKVTDSTNTLAKNTPCENGDIFIAETQTAGKGRMGREWTSEKKSGIYLSVALMPDIDSLCINQLTLVMGVAVCKTLKELYKLPFEIKWPNDIVINGKKVCGILTEGVIEKNKVLKAIVGIGINVNNKEFTDELKQKATSLYILTNKKSEREKIINRFAEIFEQHYLMFINVGIKSIIEEFKKLSATINKDVEIIKNNQIIKAYAFDISENGELMVKKEDGTTLTVNSGEVSVRGIYGYN